jgi:hypothetical protein
MTAYTPDDVARCVVQSQCEQLVLKSAQLADLQAHEALTALFTPDAELSRPGTEPILGHDAILASYRSKSPDRITKHLILGTLFDHVTADAVSAVSQVLLWTAEASDISGPFGRPAKNKAIVGEFVDEFILVDGGWRIRRRTAHFAMFQALS